MLLHLGCVEGVCGPGCPQQRVLVQVLEARLGTRGGGGDGGASGLRAAGHRLSPAVRDPEEKTCHTRLMLVEAAFTQDASVFVSLPYFQSVASSLSTQRSLSCFVIQRGRNHSSLLQ